MILFLFLFLIFFVLYVPFAFTRLIWEQAVVVVSKNENKVIIPINPLIFIFFSFK